MMSIISSDGSNKSCDPLWSRWLKIFGDSSQTFIFGFLIGLTMMSIMLCLIFINLSGLSGAKSWVKSDGNICCDPLWSPKTFWYASQILIFLTLIGLSLMSIVLSVIFIELSGLNLANNGDSSQTFIFGFLIGLSVISIVLSVTSGVDACGSGFLFTFSLTFGIFQLRFTTISKRHWVEGSYDLFTLRHGPKLICTLLENLLYWEKNSTPLHWRCISVCA